MCEEDDSVDTKFRIQLNSLPAVVVGMFFNIEGLLEAALDEAKITSRTFLGKN